MTYYDTQLSWEVAVVAEMNLSGTLVEDGETMLLAFSNTNTVNTFNKSIGAGILGDIEFIQWSVLNHQSFNKVYDLLEQKYLRKHDATLNKAIETFFQYMRSVWIESKQNLWFEGAHPWKISNNQGVEGKNKAIKQSHTFRRRLDMGQLFNVLLNMVSEWSREDRSLLLSSRLDSLFDQKDSLKLRTEGYQWYKRNMSKSDRILRINPRGKYSVNRTWLILGPLLVVMMIKVPQLVLVLRKMQR